ncbi:ester cyclase [Granulicella arctica]|uniref:ester cyclase n=1 Tax=Granulicella arctica TaxID=940613 RepID=UPI0021DF9A9D|nr:ester cyclase [Granulicella arctica]
MNALGIESKVFIEECFKALSGRPKPQDLIDRFVSDPALKEHIRGAEAGFPNYELIADQMVAEGDIVAVRCTIRGVHKGVFAGLQPTGKPVSSELMIFYKIKEERIAGHWMQIDMASLMKQLTD